MGLVAAARGQASADSAAPAPNSPRFLSLEDAQRLAFERNWDFLAAHSDVDAATALRLISREFPNPTFSIGSTKITTDHNPQSTPEGNGFWHRSYDSTLALSQLLEIGGKPASDFTVDEAKIRSALASVGYPAA